MRNLQVVSVRRNWGNLGIECRSDSILLAVTVLVNLQLCGVLASVTKPFTCIDVLNSQNPSVR